MLTSWFPHARLGLWYTAAELLGGYADYFTIANGLRDNDLDELRSSKDLNLRLVDRPLTGLGNIEPLRILYLEVSVSIGNQVGSGTLPV